MMPYTDLAGLAGNALAATAGVAMLPGVSRLLKPLLAWLMLAVFALTLLPVAGMPLAAYLRGAFGDFSITTLLLLAGVLLSPWRDRYRTLYTRQEHPFMQRAHILLIALGALLLYPMALGMGSYDPYRLGYGDLAFLAVLLAIALVAVLWRLTWIALGISLAVAAWAGACYESTNLWDYLIDPWAGIFALAVVIRIMLRAVWRGLVRLLTGR